MNNPHPNRQGTRLKPVFEVELKGKGITLLRRRTTAEGQADPSTTLKCFQLPGKISGKAMLKHWITTLGQLQMIAGQTPANRKQHGDTTTHTLA